MNKTELVAAMADQAGLSKKDAEKALKAFTDVVAEELKKDGKVQIHKRIRYILLFIVHLNRITPGLISGLPQCDHVTSRCLFEATG